MSRDTGRGRDKSFFFPSCSCVHALRTTFLGSLLNICLLMYLIASASLHWLTRFKLQHLLTGTPGWVRNASNAGDPSEKAKTVLMTHLNWSSRCAAELQGKLRGASSGLYAWLFPFCGGRRQGAPDLRSCRDPHVGKTRWDLSHTHLCALKRWGCLRSIKKSSWGTWQTKAGCAELSVLVLPAGLTPALMWKVSWLLLGSSACAWAKPEVGRDGKPGLPLSAGRQRCVSPPETLIKGDMKSSLFTGMLKMLWEDQQTWAGVEETQGKVEAGYYCCPRKGKSCPAISPKRIR